jgi:flagellar protein FlaG
MSDLIGPVGSQNLSPPTTTAAQAGTAANATTTAAQAQATSAQAATAASAKATAAASATTSSQAATLDLSTNPQATADTPAKPMDIAEAAQAFQQYLSNLPSDLQFQPDYQSGLVIFKVVNPVTQKVIRQLPPEDVVQQARDLRLAEKNHSGILLDQSL